MYTHLSDVCDAGILSVDDWEVVGVGAVVDRDGHVLCVTLTEEGTKLGHAFQS